jgi:hypothetical protein
MSIKSRLGRGRISIFSFGLAGLRVQDKLARGLDKAFAVGVGLHRLP